MTPLEDVLKGRDERAALQSRLLKGGGSRFLIQVSLNIPGFPKTIEAGDEIVAYAAVCLKEEISGFIGEETLLNGAGLCTLLVFSGTNDDAAKAKNATLRLEEETGWGRLMDLDVLTENGALKRETIGKRQRKCLLCGNDAKICAAEGSHAVSALRAEVSRLAAEFIASQKCTEPK
ncbi:citrate lyase holo-[acyl-carrier protein] synthase [Synergistaceae bacterium OttesenSCG-928-D05]|nr:citrate lyase holo-[acyl-carrier protein] synthase [Synergistaceae bacterium OttesenSCG-928-D05]